MSKGKDRINPDQVRTDYDRDASAFASTAPKMLWWEALGKSAYDRNLGREFYGRDDVKVLDLGTASGRVLVHLRDQGGIPEENMTGVEISPEQAKIARKRLPKARIIEGDISKVKLPENEYDLVTSNMVFEFCDDNVLKRALENARGAMKKQGTIFAVTTHPEKMKQDSGLTGPGKFEIDFPWGGRGPNYYRRTSDFKEAFQDAGFSVTSTEDLQVPPESRSIEPEKYDAYQKYPHIRISIKAKKVE